MSKSRVETRFATSTTYLRNTECECGAIDQRNDRTATLHPLPGDNSCVEPPDPIPNSEVKRNRADGSVALAMQE